MAGDWNVLAAAGRGTPLLPAYSGPETEFGVKDVFDRSNSPSADVLYAHIN